MLIAFGSELRIGFRLELWDPVSRLSTCDEVGGQPLGSEGIQPPPPEPDRHVFVHPALQTQALLGVTVQPCTPGPPAGGHHILLGGSYGGTSGRRALASGSGVASARQTHRRVCPPPCGCGGRAASAPRPLF